AAQAISAASTPRTVLTIVVCDMAPPGSLRAEGPLETVELQGRCQTWSAVPAARRRDRCAAASRRAAQTADAAQQVDAARPRRASAATMRATCAGICAATR